MRSTSTLARRVKPCSNSSAAAAGWPQGGEGHSSAARAGSGSAEPSTALRGTKCPGPRGAGVKSQGTRGYGTKGWECRQDTVEPYHREYRPAGVWKFPEARGVLRLRRQTVSDHVSDTRMQLYFLCWTS